MPIFTTDPATILYQMLYYFPWYVALVLIPMMVHVIIVRALGITPDMFQSLNSVRSYLLSVLYFPLFEEMIFRGLPYLFFGTLGVVVGSTVWVLLHPAWQIQFIYGRLPRSKVVGFIASAIMYYGFNSVFYSMMWLSGAGFVAILYHMIHNGWLTTGEVIVKYMKRKIEFEAPWRRKEPKFISPRYFTQPAIKFVTRRSGITGSQAGFRFVRRKAKK